MICLKGKSMTPRCQGNAILFLSATPLSLSRTLEGLFELTRRPSRALTWPCVLLCNVSKDKLSVVSCWAAQKTQDTIKNNRS